MRPGGYGAETETRGESEERMRQRAGDAGRAGQAGRPGGEAARSDGPAPSPEREPAAALRGVGVPGGPRAGDLLALQRAVRNGAVSSLLAQRDAPGPRVQRRLQIGPVDGAQEYVDGDAVRDAVMDTLGANALSMENLARMAEDGDVLVRFDTWEQAVAETEWRTYARRRAVYSYRYAELNPDGACTLEVYAPGEEDRVGYATYVMETPAPRAGPAQDATYTKAHVLGRYPKVAHLTHLYNETLGRDGPDDIYTGFGEVMLRMVEEDARGMGARLLYLEAASSPVRQDPNTNEKRVVASKPFYQKYRYASDDRAAAHNWMLAMAAAQRMGLDERTKIDYVQRQIEVMLEGMLSKAL